LRQFFPERAIYANNENRSAGNCDAYMVAEELITTWEETTPRDVMLVPPLTLINEHNTVLDSSADLMQLAGAIKEQLKRNLLIRVLIRCFSNPRKYQLGNESRPRPDNLAPGRFSLGQCTAYTIVGGIYEHKR
jgi:hypothetical protein